MSKDAHVEQPKSEQPLKSSSDSALPSGDPSVARSEQTAKPAGVACKLLRWPGDWLLVAAICSVVPWLCLLAIDLWSRTDLLFFPLCFLAAAVWIVFGTKLSNHQDHRRSRWTIGLWCAGVVGIVLAVVLFSPWFAVLGLTLVLIGWMLYRCGQEAWYRPLARTIPLFLVLVLPVSDASDAARTLERTTAASSGILLDLLGIPNLVEIDTLQLRSGELSTSRVCRGLGNPYLLLSAVVALALLVSRGALVGLLLTLSVPFWAWLGSTLYTVVGVYLLEEQSRNLFVGYRGMGVQLGVLVLLLLAVWLMALALRNFLAPFTNYSTTAGGFHKFYNWCVLWPKKDPLRAGRRSTKPEADPYAIDFLAHRFAAPVQYVVTIVLLGLTAASVNQWIGPLGAARMEPLRFVSSEAEPLLVAEDMPKQFEDMQQISFESVERQSAFFTRKHGATWAYLNQLQRIEFQVELPYRGSFPVEQEYESEDSRFDRARERFSIELDELGSVELDEVTLLDPVNGRTYVAYATITLTACPPIRTSASEGNFSAALFARSCALQPTVITVRLVIVGSERTSDEESERRRQLLLRATELIVRSLRE